MDSPSALLMPDLVQDGIKRCFFQEGDLPYSGLQNRHQLCGSWLASDAAAQTTASIRLALSPASQLPQGASAHIKKAAWQEIHRERTTLNRPMAAAWHRQRPA
jgi:hypothetical protein